MRILFLELKQLILSKIYLVCCLLIIIFAFINCQQVLTSNIRSEIYKPENITVNTMDNTVIMNNTITDLKKEIQKNEFKTYQLGFLKTTHLSKSKLQTVKQLLLKMEQTKDFNTFKSLSNQAAQEIGFGSRYSADKLYMFGKKQMTQAEYSKELQIIKSKDHYYGSYSRYFSDVMGIILGILPFFLGAYMTILDNKTKAFKTIYSRQISSIKLISMRYIALFLLSILPVLIFSVYFIIRLSSIHPLTMNGMIIFYKILFLWILPIVIMTSALGIVITLIFNSYLGSIIQIGIWFISLNMGTQNIEGNYGFMFIPRHNTLFNAAFYYNHFNNMLLNRSLYILLGLMIVMLCIYLFDLKRKGVLTHDKTHSH